MFLRRIISSFALLTAFVAGSIGVRAAENNPVTLRFKIQSSVVEEKYGDNASAIDTLKQLLTDRAPSEVRILGAASPDGPTALNEKLAGERATALVALLRSWNPSLTDEQFKVSVLPEDLEGTITEIGKSGKAWAGEAMKILRQGGDNPENALRSMDGGRVWNYLAASVFPLLRRTEVELVFPQPENGAAAGISSESDISDGSPAPSRIRDSQEGNEKAENKEKTSDSMPGWGWGLIGVLGAAVLLLGGLFAKEKSKNSKAHVRPDLPRYVPPVSPPGPQVKPDVPVRPEIPPEPDVPPKADVPPVIPVDPVVTPKAKELKPEENAKVEKTDKPSKKARTVVPVVPVAVPKEGGDSAFISQVNSIIKEKIGDPSFGVDELAAAIGISRIHLNRRLKNEAGTSPSVLLKNARMSMACELLLAGKLSVGDIAAKCGFSSPAYFSAAFKDFFGQTPVEYVRNH